MSIHVEKLSERTESFIRTLQEERDEAVATCDDLRAMLREGERKAGEAISEACELLIALKQALASSRCRNQNCSHGWHPAARAAIRRMERKP